MSSDKRRSGHKDHGPQGTQVFSREEVDALIGEAAAGQDDKVSGAELVAVSGGAEGQSFALRGERVVIGRSERCDLRVDDSSVSSEHARISRDEGGWRVVNLLSTNGTFVNEKKISSAGLSDGDRVRFGRVEFRFRDPHGRGSGGGRTATGKGRAVWVAVVVVVAAAALAFWFLGR